jgi:hypothetical protein
MEVVMSKNIYNFWHRYILFIFSLFLVGFVLAIEPVLSQDAPIPSASAMVSLFDEDTCAPPCWFGLTVGESGVDDIVSSFAEHEDLFVVEPLEIPNGNLQAAVTNLQPIRELENAEFFWREWTREDERHVVSSLLMTNGILAYLRVYMNRDVTLAETLRRLERPFVIRAYFLITDLRLILFYPELNVTVELSADHLSCNVPTMLQDFKVHEVTYFTEDGYLEGAAIFRGDPYIRHRLWDDWVSGKIEGSCLDAIQALVDAAA